MVMEQLDSQTGGKFAIKSLSGFSVWGQGCHHVQYSELNVKYNRLVRHPIMRPCNTKSVHGPFEH